MFPERSFLESRRSRDVEGFLRSFAAGSREVGVRFNKTGAVGGHIRIVADGGVLVDRDLAHTVMPQAGLALTPRL